MARSVDVRATRVTTERVGAHLAAAAAAVVMVLALANCSQPKDLPQLIVDESVADDLRALALETWDQFLAAFQPRSACFGDVELRATKTLDSRASYDPETAAVTVRVPATVVMLQGALIHEWAHHVEFQCGEHMALRPAFLLAQGLPLETPWRPDVPSMNMAASQWAEIPSEQYAEGVIVLVLGRRQVPTSARVTLEGVRAIEKWAAGEDMKGERYVQ